MFNYVLFEYRYKKGLEKERVFSKKYYTVMLLINAINLFNYKTAEYTDLLLNIAEIAILAFILKFIQ